MVLDSRSALSRHSAESLSHGLHYSDRAIIASDKARAERGGVCGEPATIAPMPHPYLLFCPYLPVSEPIAFADWELGPLQSFEDRWADPKFKDQATALLSKFVGPDHKPIANPALLCRKGK